jgi:hypothetical protein
MKRNSFIALAERSRTVLMRETGMDELDYHLLILEGGSMYLEQLVKPQADSSMELVRLYREHLTEIGFWGFYEFLFRHLEIAMAEEWSREGSVDVLQSKQWKRERLIKEVNALPWKREANNQLDAWLKDLGPKRTLIIKNNEPTQVPQHEHVSH